MKWLDVKQGSDEWRDAHLGIPSASQFDRVIQPKKLLPSASQRKYLCELVAERVLGLGAVDHGSLWMERGTALEAEAAAYYGLANDVDARLCGFALTDDGRVGASPDRLVGDHGLLEIKCPTAQVHLGYFFYGLDDAYRMQLQGQLYVTGREWVDFLSYCPGLPEVTARVQREPDAQKALHETLRDFCAELDAAQARLQSMLKGRAAA